MAVVGQGRVGVDLEHQVDLANLDDLASAVLNLQELAQFQTLQNTARAKFMYRMWVRKEAVLKLMGRGLAMEPQGVDVRGRLAVMGGINRQRYGPIHIRDAPAKPGYAAALASTCSVERLQTFEVTSHASRG